MTPFSGKFFAAFMSKYMPPAAPCLKHSGSWREAGLRNAQAIHEEELVKLVTLLMYLAVVNHLIPSLASTLQDSKLFSKKVQLRFKCIHQVSYFLSQSYSLIILLNNTGFDGAAQRTHPRPAGEDHHVQCQ
jgi:hypothetical protein